MGASSRSLQYDPNERDQVEGAVGRDRRHQRATPPEHQRLDQTEHEQDRHEHRASGEVRRSEQRGRDDDRPPRADAWPQRPEQQPTVEELLSDRGDQDQQHRPDPDLDRTEVDTGELVGGRGQTAGHGPPHQQHHRPDQVVQAEPQHPAQERPEHDLALRPGRPQAEGRHPPPIPNADPRHREHRQRALEGHRGQEEGRSAGAAEAGDQGHRGHGGGGDRGHHHRDRLPRRPGRPQPFVHRRVGTTTAADRNTKTTAAMAWVSLSTYPSIPPTASVAAACRQASSASSGPRNRPGRRQTSNNHPGSPTTASHAAGTVEVASTFARSLSRNTRVRSRGPAPSTVRATCSAGDGNAVWATTRSAAPVTSAAATSPASRHPNRARTRSAYQSAVTANSVSPPPKSAPTKGSPAKSAAPRIRITPDHGRRNAATSTAPDSTIPAEGFPSPKNRTPSSALPPRNGVTPIGHPSAASRTTTASPTPAMIATGREEFLRALASAAPVRIAPSTATAGRTTAVRRSGSRPAGRRATTSPRVPTGGGGPPPSSFRPARSVGASPAARIGEPGPSSGGSPRNARMVGSTSRFETTPFRRVVSEVRPNGGPVASTSSAGEPRAMTTGVATPSLAPVTATITSTSPSSSRRAAGIRPVPSAGILETVRDGRSGGSTGSAFVIRPMPPVRASGPIDGSDRARSKVRSSTRNRRARRSGWAVATGPRTAGPLRGPPRGGPRCGCRPPSGSARPRT